ARTSAGCGCTRPASRAATPPATPTATPADPLELGDDHTPSGPPRRRGVTRAAAPGRGCMALPAPDRHPVPAGHHPSQADPAEETTVIIRVFRPTIHPRQGGRVRGVPPRHGGAIGVKAGRVAGPACRPAP